MKVAIMQPYFFPYIGYWQLISAVDVFVIYDDVNFIKQGWINRNRILIDGQEKYINIHLKKASPNKLINEIEIFDTEKNIRKLCKTIEQSYKKAPFINEVLPLIETILMYKEKNLAKYLENLIKKMCDFLNIETEIIISSDLNKNNDYKGEQKVLDICRVLGAKEYINAIGGQNLYSKETFAAFGLALNFLRTNEIKYVQFGDEFISYLSIIDVMMFNTRNEIKKMLNFYELI